MSASDLINNRKTLIALISVAIIAAAFACYWPVRQHQFINYDDPQYITQNQHVFTGLRWENVKWSLLSLEVSNWHPVTWISHMVDVQLHDVHAGSHLLTNVALHGLNSILVFLLMIKMTGSHWRSALAGAIFALHPLHVESVAWVSERKDVLSAMFGLLTLLLYLKWSGSRRWHMYLIMVLLYLMSLAAKPMLVTLPCIMLVLDFWPLRRLSMETFAQRRRLVHLVIEKLPFLALSLASCIMTVVAQSHGGALKSAERFPLSARAANAAVAYVQYLFDALWPSGLAVIYPYRSSLPLWQVAGAIALLGCITAICWRLRSSRPHLLAGWLLFLGTLVPVIGLIQVGVQARADRYMYVPMLGLLLMLFGGPLTIKRSITPQMKTVGAALAVVICALLFICSRAQVHHWRDGIALFQHAVDVTERNAVAHLQLALEWGERRQFDREYAHYRQVLEWDPDNPVVHNNMGHDLLRQGKTEQAIEHFGIAVRAMPEFARAHFNLGAARASIGQYEQAIESYRAALKERSDMADAYGNMGIALQRLNRTDEAVQAQLEAVRLDPNSAAAHFNLAWSLLQKQEYEQSARHYRRAIQLNPNIVVAHIRLGDIAVAQNRHEEAIAHYRDALKLDHSNAESLQKLQALTEETQPSSTSAPNG